MTSVDLLVLVDFRHEVPATNGVRFLADQRGHVRAQLVGRFASLAPTVEKPSLQRKVAINTQEIELLAANNLEGSLPLQSFRRLL